MDIEPALQEQLRRRQELIDGVRRLLIDRLHVRRAPEEIDPDCPLFGAGLGLDSVDAVELVVGLDTEFGVRMASDTGVRRALRTVNTVVDLIQKERGDVGRSG